LKIRYPTLQLNNSKINFNFHRWSSSESKTRFCMD